MKSPLLIVAGAKGAVGTTVAAVAADLKKNIENTFAWLTTAHWVPEGIFPEMAFAGWDLSNKSMVQSLAIQRILPPEKYLDHANWLDAADIRRPPSRDLSLQNQVRLLKQDIQEFKASHSDNNPVFVNLLPACEVNDLGKYSCLEALYSEADPASFPDLAYALAAIQSGIPVVNFTSNDVESSLLVGEAIKAGVPWCGRDGKTGQTYLKVVIASALKARNLLIDGWYSLNILGNDDGKNLADPRKASGKLANKTEFLDTIMGYQVGDRYGRSTHKVAIDYYPPRGDSKESWDVIDIKGVFGMPMSMRLNMQLRDSILAAPMVIDLAFWMTALQAMGRAGLVPELGFYFKKAVGADPPVSFQDQIDALHMLEKLCRVGLENCKSTGGAKL
jgi:myo-inositol-1-phosphate synthase